LLRQYNKDYKNIFPKEPEDICSKFGIEFMQARKRVQSFDEKLVPKYLSPVCTLKQ